MSQHAIAELLPFYANGTLDAADRARVDAELATCEACANELHELEALAAALSARASQSPALPPRLLDDTLARIAAPRTDAAVTKLRTAWWGTPARYATAAALVVGIGAAAVAAYHQHEAERTIAGNGTVIANTDRTTSVFRVTPGPNAPVDTLTAGAAKRTAAAPVAKQNASEPAATVAKQHRLARKARIDLLVRDVEASLKQAQSTARAAGGEITSLSDESPRTADSVHSATLNLEVPAGRLDVTLDRLATLGAVQNRAVDAEDVDATIVDQEARLRNLRREEADLRALMDKGGKVTDILTVQENLSDVRGQIEQLDAQHRNDLHRVATSTIQVSVTEDRPNAAPAKPGPTARIDGAWHSGLNALADTLVAFLTTIVWCAAYAPVPLGLAAVAYGATRFLRRRPVSA